MLPVFKASLLEIFLTLMIEKEKYFQLLTLKDDEIKILSTSKVDSITAGSNR